MPIRHPPSHNYTYGDELRDRGSFAVGLGLTIAAIGTGAVLAGRCYNRFVQDVAREAGDEYRRHVREERRREAQQEALDEE